MNSVQFVSRHRTGAGAIDGQEAAKFLERAVDLLQLAETIKTEHHRKLLIDSAAKFEHMAMQVLESELAR